MALFQARTDELLGTYRGETHDVPSTSSPEPPPGTSSPGRAPYPGSPDCRPSVTRAPALAQAERAGTPVLDAAFQGPSGARRENGKPPPGRACVVKARHWQKSTAPLGLDAAGSDERPTVPSSTVAPARALPPPPTGGMPPLVLGSIIERTLAWESPTPQPSEFRFEWNKDAARHNLNILRRYGMDLDRAINAQPFSSVSFGSEFRPISVLAPLLGRHVLWPKIVQYLSHGVRCPADPIPEAARLQDLRLMIGRGNHKSATNEEARVVEMFQEEVHSTWQLPLPIAAVKEIKGAVIGPIGLAMQDTINELGEIIAKWRLTHDQTYDVVPYAKRSLNRRVRFEGLTPCRYGRALARYVHFVLHLRRRHPMERILQTKVDLKAAYRRLHYCFETAAQALVIVGGFLLMALRLTFGGASNPSQWSDVSEAMFDLANDIVRNPGWDPKTQRSPHQALIDGRVELEPDDVPFAPALDVTVTLPRRRCPKVRRVY